MASVEVRNLHGEIVINPVVGPFPVSALKRVLKKPTAVVKLMLESQILDDNEVVGGVSKGRGTTAIMAVWCPEMYEVTLNLMSREPLGLDVLPVGWESDRDPTSGNIYYFNRATGASQWHPPHVVEESGSLLIKKIGAGLVRNWNAANPDMSVEAYDRIVEVNGVQGDANQLRDALMKAYDRFMEAYDRFIEVNGVQEDPNQLSDALRTHGCIQLQIRRGEALKEVTEHELAFYRSAKFHILHGSCNMLTDENSEAASAKDKSHHTCVACGKRIDGTPIAQNDSGPLHFGCINQECAWTRYASNQECAWTRFVINLLGGPFSELQSVQSMPV